MKNYYPLLILVSCLMFAGCDDGSSSKPTQIGSSCETAGELACSGIDILSCTDGAWTLKQSCNSGGCDNASKTCYVMPDFCTPNGITVCQDNVIKTCKNAKWEQINNCGKLGCKENSLECNTLPETCTDKALQCTGSIIHECSNNNWTVKQDCGNAKCSTENNTCMPIDTSEKCNNNALQCSGNILQKCVNESWTVFKDCGNDGCRADLQDCNTKAQIKCNNDDLRCDGRILQICQNENWQTKQDCGDALCDTQNNKCHEINAANIEISPRKGLMTSEDGTSTTFNIVLKKQPTDDVTIELSGAPAAECKFDKKSITFTPNDWNVPRTVTVTGLDDNVNDGNNIYTLAFNITSNDNDFHHLNIEPLYIVNTENKIYPRLHILMNDETNINLLTNERGHKDLFIAGLSVKPAYNVFVRFKSTNPNEAVLENSNIIFTPDDWLDRDLYVEGVDDNVIDGDQKFSVVLESITSDDPSYNNIKMTNVSFANSTNKFTSDKVINEIKGLNQDDDGEPSEIIAEQLGDMVNFKFENNSSYIITGLTSEDGQSVNFSIKLKSKPSNSKKVIVKPIITDATEAAVSPESLTFDENNYNTAQNFTVKGLDDNELDGDVMYGVKFVAHSEDVKYDELESKTFYLSNKDNEKSGTPLEAKLEVRHTYGSVDKLYTSEDGLSKTLYVRLTKQPNYSVQINAYSSDESEGISSASQIPIIFNALNYNQYQSIVITGVDDKEADGDIEYDVTFKLTNHATNFDDLQIPTIKFINKDNETPATSTSSKTQRLRIMAANTTSTYTSPSGYIYEQVYDSPGMNMFYAMNPDIILIQEFRPSYTDVINGLKEHFNEDYDFVVGDGRIGNGIITKKKYPIIAKYSKYGLVYDRRYDAALIDIPGDKDLLAVSVHLYTKDYCNDLAKMADWVRSLMKDKDYYLVIGGDFNTYDISCVNPTLQDLVATRITYPRDQNGNYKTNRARKRLYDWVLVNPDLQKYSAPVVIGARSFPHGYILDSRVHTPIEDIAPVKPTDSYAPDMQHMPVIRDFVYEY